MVPMVWVVHRFPPASLQVGNVASPSKAVNSNFVQARGGVGKKQKQSSNWADSSATDFR